MIKIAVNRLNNKIVELDIKGHANSGPYGSDLVCAAVSAVAIGGLNNLLNPQAYEIKISEGHIHVVLIDKSNEHDEIVIETIVKSLETIEIDNKKYVLIQNLEK